MSDAVRIWSLNRTAWWRGAFDPTGRQGENYTHNIAEAGLYGREAAEKIVERANRAGTTTHPGLQAEVRELSEVEHIIGARLAKLDTLYTEGMLSLVSRIARLEETEGDLEALLSPVEKPEMKVGDTIVVTRKPLQGGGSYYLACFAEHASDDDSRDGPTLVIAVERLLRNAPISKKVLQRSVRVGRIPIQEAVRKTRALMDEAWEGGDHELVKLFIAELHQHAKRAELEAGKVDKETELILELADSNEARLPKVH